MATETGCIRTIKVENVVGTDIEMIQKTDYPWSGNISITVNPKQSKNFTVTPAQVFERLSDRAVPGGGI